jgi:dTDP-4-dehydrorhamnose 3,5-epimerase
MSLKTIETGIPGLVIVEPVVHGDERGFFMETWNSGRYEEAGLPGGFVQSNLSRSGAGVIRGLHFQYPEPQGKLVSVLEGRVFDVAVDIRPLSATFKQWVGVELSDENHRQLYVPEGFAHGFCVLSESVLLSYLCTAVYRSEFDAVIAWNDPDIDVQWPLKSGRLSSKDDSAPLLRDFANETLPGMDS